MSCTVNEPTHSRSNAWSIGLHGFIAETPPNPLADNVMFMYRPAGGGHACPSDAVMSPDIHDRRSGSREGRSISPRWRTTSRAITSCVTMVGEWRTRGRITTFSKGGRARRGLCGRGFAVLAPSRRSPRCKGIHLRLGDSGARRGLVSSVDDE
jgi:hypothetical protein